jgi:hypothetical protein
LRSLRVFLFAALRGIVFLTADSAKIIRKAGKEIYQWKVGFEVFEFFALSANSFFAALRGIIILMRLFLFPPFQNQTHLMHINTIPRKYTIPGAEIRVHFYRCGKGIDVQIIEIKNRLTIGIKMLVDRI